VERILGRPNVDRPKKARTKKLDYAIPADFCRVFQDHLDDLYTLSLLLTADRHQAERCFVSGLDDCLHGNPVFREWAKSWARRTVIKNAIRMISPLRNETATMAMIPLSETDTAFAAIASLKPFDRFVYVLSVLERYSDSECSILLDCSVERVVDARIRSLERLGNVASRKGPAETAPTKGAAEARFPVVEQFYGEAL
jgi:hypothetical protein